MCKTAAGPARSNIQNSDGSFSFILRWRTAHVAETDVCLTSSGPQPATSKGTHVIMPLVEVATDPLWEATVVKQDGNRINLKVKSPPTAAIGRYRLTVETNCASGRAVSVHDPANDIYLLFNPWCKGTETPRSAASCSPAHTWK